MIQFGCDVFRDGAAKWFLLSEADLSAFVLERIGIRTFTIRVKPQPQKKERQQPQHVHTPTHCATIFPEVASPIRCNSLCAMLDNRSLGFDVADVPRGKRLRHTIFSESELQNIIIAPC